MYVWFLLTFSYVFWCLRQVDYLYLAKSACWKLDKKRIFNYRRIIFNPVYLPDRYKNIVPSDLVESILSAAAFLSTQGQEKSSYQMYVLLLLPLLLYYYQCYLYY